MKIKLIKENIDGDRAIAMAAEKIYNLMLRMEPKTLEPEENEEYPILKKQWIFDDMKPRIMRALIASRCKRILQWRIPEEINLKIISKRSPEYKSGVEGSYSRTNGEDTITIATHFSIHKGTQALKRTMKGKKTILIHEIAHMVDMMTNEKYGKYQAQNPKKYDYWNDGAEINARWAETISNLKHVGLIKKDGDPGEFDDRWIKAGKKTIKFLDMKLSKQRKFLQKLYELHSILKSEFEENEGKKWMKDMKKRMSFMDD